jgi:hypothetical protein
MPDTKQEQEAILDELLITIRAKRLEYQDWEAKLRKANNELSGLATKITEARKELQRLNESQVELQNKIKEDQVFAKDQLNEVAKERQDLSKERQANEQLKVEAEEKNKEAKEQAEQNKKKETELKDREQKYSANQINLNKQGSAFRREQDLFAQEKLDFERVKKEYVEKLKIQDADQNKVIANLDQSEELKKVLEVKIKENEALNIRLKSVLLENEAKSKNLDNQKKDNEEIRQRITQIEAEQKARSRQQDARDKELDEKDTQTKLRELRVKKLARDNGVEEELKKLEEELKNK